MRTRRLVGEPLAAAHVTELVRLYAYERDFLDGDARRVLCRRLASER